MPYAWTGFHIQDVQCLIKTHEVTENTGNNVRPGSGKNRHNGTLTLWIICPLGLPNRLWALLGKEIALGVWVKMVSRSMVGFISHLGQTLVYILISDSALEFEASFPKLNT